MDVYMYTIKLLIQLVRIATSVAYTELKELISVALIVYLSIAFEQVSL